MHHLDEIHRSYNLSDDHGKESFCEGVVRWATYIHELLADSEPKLFLERLPSILNEAWWITGIRSQLFQLLARDRNVCTDEENEQHVAIIGNILTGLEYVFTGLGHASDRVRTMRGIYSICAVAPDHMSIIWTKDREVRDADDRYFWRDYAVAQKTPLVIYGPGDHLDVDTTTESRVERIDADTIVKMSQVTQLAHQRACASLLSGQGQAYDDLMLMLKARKEGLCAGGIAPRLHALLIGPSGSGKTHVVRQFASANGLAIFEQSAASWIIRGARTEVSTSQRIAEFVKNNQTGVIYLDEVEKPFPPQKTATIAWERYCCDEFMSLLDAKVERWEHWSAQMARKLEKEFFIVLSGAWQGAYAEAYHIHRLLGGDWSNLSIADTFLESNHLPAELLNRVSTNIIEILPPTREELRAMILSVQRDLGLEENKNEALVTATEIIEEKKGVRGVESYMLKRWMAIQRETPASKDLPIMDLRTNEIPPSLSGDSAGSVA